MSKKVYFNPVPQRIYRPEDDDGDFSDTLSDGLESIPNYIEETPPPPNVDIQTEPTQDRRDPSPTETSGKKTWRFLPLDDYLPSPSLSSSDVEVEEVVLSNPSTTPTTPSATAEPPTPSKTPTTQKRPPISARTTIASTRSQRPAVILCPWGDCPVWVKGFDYKPLRDHINSKHVRGVTGDELKCQWPGCRKTIKLPRGVGGHMNKHYRGG